MPVDFTKFREALDFASNALHLVGIMKKGADGVFSLDGDTIRRHLPRMSKKAEHESRWTVTLGKLEPNLRTAILHHFMANLHEEQQADLVQSVSDAVQANADAEALVLTHLRHIANIPYNTTSPGRQQQLRIDYADSLNWIKGTPEEYLIVRIQQWAGRRFDNLTDLYDWLNDPTGPVIQQLNNWETASRNRTPVLQAHWAARLAVHPPQPYHAYAPAVQMQGMNAFRRFVYRLSGIQNTFGQIALVCVIATVFVYVYMKS